MRCYLKIKAVPENPTYDVVIIPGNGQKFPQKPNEIATFGLWVKPHFEKAGIDFGVVDDYPLITDVLPWLLASPVIKCTLSQFQVNTFSGLAYGQRYLEQCEGYKGFNKIFTHGLKKR